MNFFKKFSENLISNKEKNKARFDIDNFEANPEPETIKKLECKPIKDFYLLSDDEIIKKLHSLIEPIYPVLDEVRLVREEWESKKKWLEEDEIKANSSVLTIAEYDFPFSHDEYDEIYRGYLIYDDDDDYPYKIDDFFKEVDKFFDCYYEEYSYGIDHYDQKSNFIYDIKFELVRIFWSAMNIDEDLIKVNKFWKEYSKKIYESWLDNAPTKYEKEQFKIYEKAFFFGEKERVRAARLFRQFNEERLYKTNNWEPVEEEEFTSTKESGFVYFIRNKDIYKIGITQNMMQRMEKLKPDELLNSVRCTNYRELEKEIHSQFKGCRIPQTEYFRLNEREIIEVHQILKDKAF